jgi:hypothetical protein
MRTIINLDPPQLDSQEIFSKEFKNQALLILKISFSFTLGYFIKDFLQMIIIYLANGNVFINSFLMIFTIISLFFIVTYMVSFINMKTIQSSTPDEYTTNQML